MASGVHDQLGALTLNVHAKFADNPDLGEGLPSLGDPECESLAGAGADSTPGEAGSGSPAEGGTDGTDALYGYEDPERNLLKNWSFEEPISDADWRLENASATRIQDSHTGDWSLHVHSR